MMASKYLQRTERYQDRSALPQQQRIYHYGDFHCNLQKRLYLQWVSRKNCDLIICSEGCSLPVHSCVVACFSAKVFSLISDSADCMLTLQVDFDPEAVIELVTFMYTGYLKLSRHIAQEMLKCAKWFGVTVAVTFVQEYLQAFVTLPLQQTKLQKRNVKERDPVTKATAQNVGQFITRQIRSHLILKQQTTQHSLEQNVPGQQTARCNLGQNIPAQQTARHDLEQNVSAQQTTRCNIEQHVRAQQTTHRNPEQNVAAQQTTQRNLEQNVAAQQTTQRDLEQHLPAEQTTRRNFEQIVSAQRTTRHDLEQNVTAQQTTHHDPQQQTSGHDVQQMVQRGLGESTTRQQTTQNDPKQQIAQMDQQTAQYDLKQGAIQSDLQQTITQHDLEQQTIQHILVLTTQKDLGQQSVHHPEQQSAQERDFEQLAIQLDLEQLATQEQQAAQRDLEQIITQYDLERQTTHRGLEQGTVQCDLPQQTMQQWTAWHDREQRTAAQFLEQWITRYDLEQQGAERDLKQQTTQQNLERSDAQCALEQQITDRDPEWQITEHDLEQPTTSTQHCLEQQAEDGDFSNFGVVPDITDVQSEVCVETTHSTSDELVEEINLKQGAVEVDPTIHEHISVSEVREHTSNSHNACHEPGEVDRIQQQSDKSRPVEETSALAEEYPRASTAQVSSSVSVKKKEGASAKERTRGRKRRKAKMDDVGSEREQSSQSDGETSRIQPQDAVDDSLDAESKRKEAKISEYTCRLCKHVVETKRELGIHFRLVHGPFPCEECPESFLRKESLTRHVQKQHRSPKDLTCQHCNASFQVQSKFEQHCKKAHNETKPYPCDFEGCDFRTNKVKSLNIHKENVHAMVRNFVCERCGDRFPSQIYLFNHERNCLNTGQHLCPECGVMFNVGQALRNHIRVIHRGELPFPCKICGRLFSDHRNRSRHMRIHNNDFPYACKHCGQKFRHSNSVKAHVAKLHLPITKNDKLSL
ncbi:hypothetical protein BaRGS_00008958 [Batillaria attramentaria]|uniref:Uncharacterized protein n=1 Tax=Batillaria attramentaria TaxID=370345 RepID=A0ABD0LKM2_9CAEN